MAAKKMEIFQKNIPKEPEKPNTTFWSFFLSNGYNVLASVWSFCAIYLPTYLLFYVLNLLRMICTFKSKLSLSIRKIKKSANFGHFECISIHLFDISVSVEQSEWTYYYFHSCFFLYLHLRGIVSFVFLAGKIQIVIIGLGGQGGQFILFIRKKYSSLFWQKIKYVPKRAHQYF